MQPPTKHSRPAGSDADPAKKRSRVGVCGGLARIVSAFGNTVNGIREGAATEAAIRQELAVACAALPLAFFLAPDVWTWGALMGSLLIVLAVEFLNTAIARLCDHVQPEIHEQIQITKDFASAGVFFTLVLAALVWSAALAVRLAAST